MPPRFFMTTALEECRGCGAARHVDPPTLQPTSAHFYGELRSVAELRGLRSAAMRFLRPIIL